MNKNTIGYIAVVALLVLTSCLSLKIFLTQRIDHDIVDMRKFPYTIGEWTGKDLKITDQEYRLLETRNLIMREYLDSSNKKSVYLFIVYSETNRSVFHPPEACLIGSSVKIVDKKIAEIKYDKFLFLANKLYTEKNDFREMILYSYKAGKLYTENFYLQQAYLIFCQMLGNRVPGATIRVDMPIMGDEEATLSTLKEFLGKTAEIVDGLSKKAV